MEHFSDIMTLEPAIPTVCARFNCPEDYRRPNYTAKKFTKYIKYITEAIINYANGFNVNLPTKKVVIRYKKEDSPQLLHPVRIHKFPWLNFFIKFVGGTRRSVTDFLWN